MWKCTQRAFTGGVQDDALRGRQDLAVYYTAAKSLDNFIVKRQGCIEKRRGTDLVANLDGLFGEGWTVSHVRAIPFVYERDGGYVLLFVEGAKTVTTTETEYKRGFCVCSSEGILLNVRRKQIGGVGLMAPTIDREAQRWHHAPSFTEIEVSGNDTWEITGTAVMIEIPYAGEDFNDIGYTQSGDTLFVAHRDYPFATIKRTGDSVFAYEPVDFMKQGASTAYLPPIISASLGTNDSDGSDRTVSYVATYVKNGIESAPSTPVYVTYKMPWSNEFSVRVNIDKGDNAEEPDFYNVYKKSGGEYGFIASTGDAKAVVYPTLDSKNTTGTFGAFCLKQYDRWKKSNTVVANNNIKSKFFSGGYQMNYADYGRHGSCVFTFGGIVGDKSVKLAFGKGVQFVEFSAVEGIASRYYAGDILTIDKEGLSYTHCKGTTLKATLALSKGDTNETIEATASVTAQGDTDFIVETDDKWDKRYSILSVDQVRAKVNAQVVAFDFRTAIEEAFPNDDGWQVDSLEIHAYTDASMTDESEVPVYLSSMELKRIDKNANYIDDDYITPDVSLTPPSNEPHFDAAGKYPSCVALKEQRLVLAATSEQPFTLFFSTTGDLYNFNTHDSIRDDDAIEATIPATEFPEVNHIVSARELLVLCDNGEWVVKPSSGNALTYRTLEIKQQSQIGCSKRLPPLAIGDEAIFAENTAETLRAIKYSWESDGFVSTDLSVMSQTLTRNNPIIDYAYKQHPDSTIVCVLQDGSLAILTYMKEHEVCAWSTARLGGGLTAVGICTDKAITDGTTNLYLVAKREKQDEQGKVSYQYQLLRVRESNLTDTVRNAICLDAIEEVVATADTKLNGRIAIHPATGKEVKTLTPGETYLMGYPFDAVFRSVRPEAQGQDTIQFELKNPANVEIRLRTPSNFKVVPTDLEDARHMATVVETKTRVEDGKIKWDAQNDHLLPIAGDYNISGAITLRTTSHLPFELLSYSVNFSIDPRHTNQRG